MRTLLLIRHAKSSAAGLWQSDYDRALDDKGKREAGQMGEKLLKLHLAPELIISSPARRAKQTALRIAEKVGYDPEKIRWEEKLYHCIPSVFEEIIYGVDDDVRTAYIVAHNPGITDFANDLSPGFTAGHMPTCGVTGVRTKEGKWEDFSTEKREVFLFEYPGKD